MHANCNSLDWPVKHRQETDLVANMRERSGVSVTMEQLSELQKIPIMELRREELSDANEVVIDTSKSLNQRAGKESVCTECGGIYITDWICRGRAGNTG